MLAFLLVMGRVFSSSWSNVVQKQLMAKNLSSLLIVSSNFMLLSVMILPFLGLISFADMPKAFWWNITIAALLDIPGNVFLIKSVGKVDLSIFGPLNSYKPIVALVLGIFLLNEIPSVQGLTGVGIVFLGSFFLAPSGEKLSYKSFYRLMKAPGVGFRFASLFMTASASIFLKAAINHSSAMHTFTIWAFFGIPISLVSLYFLNRPDWSEIFGKVKKDFPQLALLAFLFLALQMLTLQIFAVMNVAYALSLFQLSAVVNVFFGHRIFGETNILQRTIGSLIMAGGAVLLILT